MTATITFKFSTSDVIAREINIDKFMARNPSLIGSAGGVSFYEHPVHGDEAPLVAVFGGNCGYSHWHEVPEVQEFAEVA